MAPKLPCAQCGTCCVAPDIAALDKPLGVRCPHLTTELRCGVYERRPDICRRYEPGEICRQVAAPTLEQRVERYLALFGMTEEARRIREQGTTSMREARARTAGAPLSPGSRGDEGAPATRAQPLSPRSRGDEGAGGEE